MHAVLDKYKISLMISAVLWGTAFVAVKIGVEFIDPVYFAMQRFVIAAIILIAVVVILKRFDLHLFKDRTIVLIGVLNGLAFVIQNVGLELTTATNAALLVNINVGIVAILAAVMLGESMNRRVILGLLVGLMGVVTISTNGDLASIFSGGMVGDLLVFSSGVLWAFCIIFQKKAVTRHEDPMMFTAAMITTTALFLIPMTLLFTRDYSMGDVAWATSLYVGIFCTGLAYLAYNFGLKKVKASVASVILLLEIVFATLFAILILGEIPTLITLLGGGLIILSILVITLAQPNNSGADH